MSNPDISKPIAAVIGGTGFSEAFDAVFGASREEMEVATPYGTAAVSIFTIDGGRRVAFIRRHGAGHSVAPHRINHHANVFALHRLGIDTVFATAAVGGLRRDLTPGDVLVLHDFLDLRRGEPTTFFSKEGDVRHTDFSEPFSSRLRDLLNGESKALSGKWDSPPNVHGQGVYLCLSGPRYETPAEVKLFATWGADVVGMTAAPEAILAREINMDYACLSVVTNLGTGLSSAPLAHEDVTAQMAASRPFVVALLDRALRRLAGIPTKC